MSEDQIPSDSKLTTSKRRWAAEGKFLTGKISRAEDERLPPGQHLVRNWRATPTRRFRRSSCPIMRWGRRRPRS